MVKRQDKIKRKQRVKLNILINKNLYTEHHFVCVI